MALICCKTSSTLILVLMLLAGTEGAKILREPHSKNNTYSEEEDMVRLQLDVKLLKPVTTMTPLNNKSISPWTWNTSQDGSVYPSVSEARCLLKGCLDSEGREDMSLESKPIFHQVLLLRRVRSSLSHGYHYKLEQRLIAVGCTCVQPLVLQQY